MLNDNMRRGGDGRDAKIRVEWVLDTERKRSLQITGKRLGGSWEGWAVGFYLPRNSRGWLSLSTKVSVHTLNLLPDLFFPKKIDPDNWSCTVILKYKGLHWKPPSELKMGNRTTQASILTIPGHSGGSWASGLSKEGREGGNPRLNNK
jgi:hypothetical protein